MASLRPLRIAAKRGTSSCCPKCRDSENDQRWSLVSGLGPQLTEGVDLNESRTFSVKARICHTPVGNHYAAYGGSVDIENWEMSTTNKAYAHFWTTCQPGPTNKFFSGLENGLRARDLEVTYHRAQSKQHGQIGMRCNNCGMSVVLQWPRALKSEETISAQQILATLVDPQPFQPSIQDAKPMDIEEYKCMDAPSKEIIAD